MSSLRPTTVLFDFGGTLDADGVPWKERFHRLWCEEVGETDPATFAPLFYAADDALVGRVPSTLSFHETVQRIALGVSRVAGRRDEMAAMRVAKRFVEDAMEHLRGTALILHDLSRRYRLGIVSNFYGNLASICAETGLTSCVATIVDSACVGCTKPDPRIFFSALDELKSVPKRTVFVGDSLNRDMVGARDVGMAHIWLTPQTGEGRAACCPEDPVIHTLGAVLELL